MTTYRVILKSGADFLVEAEGIETSVTPQGNPEIGLTGKSRPGWVALGSEIAAIVEVGGWPMNFQQINKK